MVVLLGLSVVGEVVISLDDVVGVMSLKLISPRWTQLSDESLGKENSTK